MSFSIIDEGRRVDEITERERERRESGCLEKKKGLETKPQGTPIPPH